MTAFMVDGVDILRAWVGWTRGDGRRCELIAERRAVGELAVMVVDGRRSEVNWDGEDKMRLRDMRRG